MQPPNLQCLLISPLGLIIQQQLIFVVCLLYACMSLGSLQHSKACFQLDVLKFALYLFGEIGYLIILFYFILFFSIMPKYLLGTCNRQDTLQETKLSRTWALSSQNTHCLLYCSEGACGGQHSMSADVVLDSTPGSAKLFPEALSVLARTRLHAPLPMPSLELIKPCGNCLFNSLYSLLGLTVNSL